MFADRVAFVDLETTGMSPGSCAITEIGIVLVIRDGKAITVTEWSSLVNPQRPIPPEIQFLTGISNAMVANAPSFAELAPTLAPLLQDAIFVAHHARFDYGFIKQAFADIGTGFTEKTLCTVRLSKLLDPDRSPHSLDALIHRHRLGENDRHRALGDARLIYRYLVKMYQQRGAEVLEPAIRRLLKQPSLPAHLPANALLDIPNTPGVYQFLGVNDQPLYIGKSIHLRERVASHFVNDHRSERGVRLASEIRRIDWQETAGDFGAQLLERRLIRSLQPSHNTALRRKENQIVLAPLVLPPAPAQVTLRKQPKSLQWRRVDEVLPIELPGYFGPFGSRASARHWFIEHAPAEGLCLGVLGFERLNPGAPCFNRQLGRCAGCCTANETLVAMLDRLGELLKPLAIPVWPFPDGLLCRESGHLAASERAPDWHLFDQWCYLGSSVGSSTVSSDADSSNALPVALERLVHAERKFDADTYRLLRRALPADLGGLTGLDDADPSVAAGAPARDWNLQFSMLTLSALRVAV